ncbi:hypothetical protein [Corallococcus sp. AS-1-6]|uniref:hypothetical protein n=1 Tax=Corallococcus sp. AS-1-6 TaxID=2874599 RepID=UPI001CBC01EC|nr:hypothetical protein [Corallococcus sp. AS-1-6]MBZ4373801.1 hypothetical protein [Corallococcus sp. AS-1-6]
MKQAVIGVAVCVAMFACAANAAKQAATDAPSISTQQSEAVEAQLESAAAKTEAAEAKVEAAAARVEAADAKVETAEVQKTTAIAAAKSAEDQLNDARANKLIRYGVTAGFAVVAQSRSPGPAGKDAKQKSLNITTMPYLVLVPAFWFIGDSLATYCASNYIGRDEAAATAAAIERAQARARVAASPDLQRRLNSSEQEVKQAANDEIYEMARSKIWDPDPSLKGKCGWTRVGLYLGKPSDYDASIQPTAVGPELKRKVNPTGSVGVAFVPNAYVTVLLGLTASSYTEPAVLAADGQSEQPESTRRFMNFTFGVGGNLDLLGAIFR